MKVLPESRAAYPIEAVEVAAYKIPTEEPEESDGTLCWNATTMVLVELHAAGEIGLGYTYAGVAAATFIKDLLADTLLRKDAMQTAARNAELYAKARNNGRSGIAAMAISAIDIALWDLKGKVLRAPVCALLGPAREAVPIYGSGGFTSYTLDRLTEQLGSWVHRMRIPRVKMKIGRDPEADPSRVAAARKAIGPKAQLFVDANGAYSVKQALDMARRFAESDVCWYEEPVPYDDLDGNAKVREQAPAGMEISNGEYGFAPADFLRILQTRAADVLQADVTRCGGFSGFRIADALCRTYNTPLSSHCAPYVTLHAASSAQMLRHIEYFHDHVRIERMLFDGPSDPYDGRLTPDLERPGIGLELKRRDAERYLL